MRVENSVSLLQLSNSSSQASTLGESFEKFLEEVNTQLLEAKESQERLMNQDATNLVEMMSSIEKADISLRMVTEIRNKALEAYQEVMRMQI